MDVRFKQHSFQDSLQIFDFVVISYSMELNDSSMIICFRKLKGFQFVMSVEKWQSIAYTHLAGRMAYSVCHVTIEIYLLFIQWKLKLFNSLF